MKYLKLPDLGEGLVEAEIVEWYVQVGDEVAVDQKLVAVETAKAIVDLPAPVAGKIETLFGRVGDIVNVGEPLIEFVTEEKAAEDFGTVVGELKSNQNVLENDNFIIGSANIEGFRNIQCTPAIRDLARKLKVDLSTVKPTGQFQMITAADVEKAANLQRTLGEAKPLRGVRRAMMKNMVRAHAEIAPVTIFDDADIHQWGENQDITLRLIRAISAGIAAEPNLNAWFESATNTLRVIKELNLGIAVDTKDGLFVPVMRNIAQRPAESLRQGLDNLRADVKSRSIPPSELTGATITLTNFGTIFGKYGTPIVVPPMVAILGAGVIRDQVVAHEGKPAVHKQIPLSLTFDHRVVTGGEAARFLKGVVQDLEAKN